MQPLILDDGTVYGVLGVELLESYMDTKLPCDDLHRDHHGSYLLASTTSDLKGEVLALQSAPTPASRAYRCGMRNGN